VAKQSNSPRAQERLQRLVPVCSFPRRRISSSYCLLAILNPRRDDLNLLIAALPLPQKFSHLRRCVVRQIPLGSDGGGG
jgi:hypothetical protein